MILPEANKEMRLVYSIDLMHNDVTRLDARDTRHADLQGEQHNLLYLTQL